MAFTRMAFNPEEGLRKVETYPSTPASEGEARDQVQGRLDEVRDYINRIFLPSLECAQSSLGSGSEKIGSKAIDGLDIEGTSVVTVWDQLSLLKTQLKQVVSQGVEDGGVTSNKLAADAVTEAKIENGAVTTFKIAADSIGTSQIIDGSITASKIADVVLSGACLTNASVTEEKLAPSAVTELKIGAGAITETKLSNSAVTSPKIADNAITTIKIMDNSMVASKIADGSITMEKIADGNVTAAKIAPLSTVMIASSGHINFASTADYIYYNSNRLMLHVNGCCDVQLTPILYGTSTSPTSGNYPAGTLYIQVQL